MNALKYFHIPLFFYMMHKVNYNFSNLLFPIRKTVSLLERNDNFNSEMDMNSMQKTPEQKIDEAVESLKALFLPQARNK